MKFKKESLKTMGKWVGAASGVGIPAASFFTSLTPPLFQEVSLITTALSGAIVAMAAKRRPRPTHKGWQMPVSTTLAPIFLAVAIVFLVGYVLLLQFTTVIGPEGSETRYQIGFGTTDWSLTDVAKGWKRENPALTPKELLMKEAAFDQDRVAILWTTRSIYAAGALLILLYFLGFTCWTLGFAFLKKH